LPNISTKSVAVCTKQTAIKIRTGINNMNALSHIKSQVMYLFNTNPKVHIDISNKGERKHLSNVPAVITAVYSNIFTATLNEDGVVKKYTFQYADLLIHNVVIKELNKLNG
ncbi:MAG: hypothetical protein IKB92_01765, partial [Clostridia bacterium]|nr:hypothetical protein [Clostridia bacterium]